MASRTSFSSMMISEITEGNWVDAFKVKHLDKYAAPTVEGIDFPSLGIDQAWNDKESGVLHVGTYAADRNRVGAETSWRVTGLPNARDVFILADGAPYQNIEVIKTTQFEYALTLIIIVSKFSRVTTVNKTPK
ncbi:MAG: hypothetical protein Ct9H90mP25_5210 [Gammaproteobacteria bacterium]|nr:MAG: hypothetical protein Ct9H90mP25_5210 [Gammaproteobacteria bacterium]